MAAARCIFLHGRRGGQVGQQHRLPYRARRHPCADGGLWDETLDRLKQHRGQQKTGGGNHRGSIFRLIVGTAVMARNGHDLSSSGRGADVRAGESALECEASKVICAMPFLWLAIDDEPGAESLRGYIESRLYRAQ